MNIVQGHREEYYIIFQKSKLDHWIMKWIDPFFQHVYAVKLSPGGHFWIKINPTMGVTEVDLLPVKEYPGIRFLCGKEAKVILVEARLRNPKRWRVWQLNCVEFTKTLLGINKWNVITPKQLYRYLINQGVCNG